MDREIFTILGIFLLIYLNLRTSTQIKRKWQNQDHLGDNCIQNFVWEGIWSDIQLEI